MYDLESFLTDIETVFKNNLNNKIDAINTEKGDSITLKQVDANAYTLDLDSTYVNYDPFIVYGYTDIESEGIGPATRKTISLNIFIVVADYGQDASMVKRMLRYQRALEEVVHDNFFKIRACDMIKVQALPVLDFVREDDSQRYKIVGIDLISSIA